MAAYANGRKGSQNNSKAPGTCATGATVNVYRRAAASKTVERTVHDTEEYCSETHMPDDQNQCEGNAEFGG